MKKMYYSSFPSPPLLVVSGIAASAGIPAISSAYVGTDNSLFLDVFQSEDFRVTGQHLEDIAEFCGVTPAEVFVEPGIDDDHVSISLVTTCFDFSDCFKGHRLEKYVQPKESVPPLPGEEDSQDWIEAQDILQRFFDRY